jgi:SAM-dependent methyltransferase
MTEITFSFGENWRDFLSAADEEAIELAGADIEHWLGAESFESRTVLDIGCGSGLHSLAFHLKGASQLVSFDYDPHSVSATRSLWERAGRPGSWTVRRESILDDDFVATLGTFDVVYAWGVLHHTGNMWKAIENAFALTSEGGVCWLALYQKGPRYARDLALKERFNRAPAMVKKLMIWQFILRTMAYRASQGRNPMRWNERKARGMDTYHDIVDWLGGLPYEVATVDEVLAAGERHGFEPMTVLEASEGGCSVVTLRREDRRSGSSERR